MNEKTITITERDGEYQIQNSGMSEFTLIGMLECILFDLKSAQNRRPLTEQESASAEQNEATYERKGADEQPSVESNEEQSAEAGKKSSEKPKSGITPATNAPELRTRIANAVKAIRALGGEADEMKNRKDATDEELQTELEELTEQYKRLKNSKSAK
jgi:FtsZ-binding cell division protein ZapB